MLCFRVTTLFAIIKGWPLWSHLAWPLLNVYWNKLLCNGRKPVTPIVPDISWPRNSVYCSQRIIIKDIHRLTPTGGSLKYAIFDDRILFFAFALCSVHIFSCENKVFLSSTLKTFIPSLSFLVRPGSGQEVLPQISAHILPVAGLPSSHQVSTIRQWQKIPIQDSWSLMRL